MRTGMLALMLVATGACGESGGSSTDTESGSSSGGGSTGGQTATETGAPSSSTGAGSSSSGGDESSSGTTSGAVLTELETEVTQYPEQPMVVDVTVSGNAPLPETLALGHDDDPGVRIATIAEPDASSRTYRVRGLAPETAHAMTVSAGDISAQVDFTTDAALPGFIPAFAVRGEGSGERPWRMFDLNPFPEFTTSSLFMIDASGRTRFHLGQALDAEPGPDAVLAAAKLRDDGTVMLLSNHALRIIDELGHDVLRLEDDALGITGLHHDVIELDTGNFVALSNSFQTVDYPGVGPTLTAGDVLVEFTPDGEVVWQWDSFDEMDPLRITEPLEDGNPLVHPTSGEDTYDWTHANGVVLSPDGTQFIVSLRHQDWMIAINRDTRTIDWRLGPDGDFNLTEGRWFYHPHSPQWQADGSLLLYDNGVGRPDGPPFARVVRYTLDMSGENNTATQVWEDDDQTFAAPIAGDCDVLGPSGHYLVTDSAMFLATGALPRVRELDPTADPMTVWELSFPNDHFAYRTTGNDRLVGEAAR